MMRRFSDKWRAAPVVFAMAGLTLGSVQAADLPGDPTLGQKLVEEICAECHITDGGEPSPPNGPPAFQTIADDRMVTETSLRVFFQTPHVDMPNLMLSDADIDHISAYILSLRDGE